MQCSECGKRPATIHVTKIENGKKTDMYLCEQCAVQKNAINLNTTFSVNDFITGLINSGGVIPFKVDIVQEPKCEVCGLTYNKFREMGKFGCSNCYKLFGDKLDPLFKKLHGNIKHTGKIPNKAGHMIKVNREIESLKSELNQAISSEEYEKAAELRDKIKALNNKEQGDSK